MMIGYAWHPASESDRGIVEVDPTTRAIPVVGNEHLATLSVSFILKNLHSDKASIPDARYNVVGSGGVIGLMACIKICI